MAWLNDIVVGALSNGVNSSTLVLLNVILGLTLGSLVLLFYSSLSKNPALIPHVAVLIFLAVGLAASINWLVLNIGLVDPKDQKIFGGTDSGEPSKEKKDGEQEERDEDEGQASNGRKQRLKKA